MEKIYDGDATASFSGYLYQADVALLVTLEKIKEIGIINIDELKKWSLEVEGEEDFTLIKTEYGKVVEKHLYQVKEYEEGTRAKYLDGVIKLFKCSLENNNPDLNKCKTYICGKMQIKHYTNIQTNEDLINTIITDDKEDLGEIKYLILNPTNTLNKEDRKKEYKKNEVLINKNFETKIKENKEKFKNNFSIGRVDGFGDFSQIHEEIQDLISQIKTGKSKGDKEYEDFYKQSDNYLRYFESIIKRMIQGNKNNKNREKLKLHTEILNKILDFDRFELKAEDYQDMFFCNFIQHFNDTFVEFYILPQDDIINNIYIDLGSDKEKYNDFLDSTRDTISENIFNYKENINKFSIFINHTLSKDIYLPKNMQEYSKLLYNFSDIKNKICLLLTYFYAKENCIDLKDDFFEGIGEKYIINKNSTNGILTGLPSSKSSIQNFINTHVFFNYEMSNIGVFNHDEKNLGDYLGSNTPQLCFFENTKTKEYHKNYNKSITSTKAIKIFGGHNCLKSNANNYLT